MEGETAWVLLQLDIAIALTAVCGVGLIAVVVILGLIRHWERSSP